MSEGKVVGVLLGGTSPEREVSLSSGTAVAEALEAREWTVRRYDYGLEGEEKHGSVAARLEHALTDGDFADVDLVFITLHGGAGEDGRVQSYLELAGVPYTGTGVLGSAVSMDKWITKSLVRRAGVTVPEARLWTVDDPLPENMIEADWGAVLGWPLVIKPVNQGSTVGFSIVEAAGEVPAALEKAAVYGSRVLVEEYIAGREVTVAVLGDQALPVIEIHPSHGVYDYECKYTKGMSSYTCPADLPERVAAKLQDDALKAFEVLHHRDFSRMDYRLAEDGTPYLLEGNTLPGFTATSLVPKAAAAVGINFGELCTRLAEAALGRQGDPI